jgi:hypothetical protein
VVLTLYRRGRETEEAQAARITDLEHDLADSPRERARALLALIDEGDELKPPLDASIPWDKAAMAAAIANAERWAVRVIAAVEQHVPQRALEARAAAVVRLNYTGLGVVGADTVAPDGSTKREWFDLEQRDARLRMIRRSRKSSPTRSRGCSGRRTPPLGWSRSRGSGARSIATRGAGDA